VSSKKTIFGKLVLVCVVLALSACGMVRKDEDASVIEQKAVQRWNYLIAHKAEKAYDYLSPGYRATKTRESYAAGMNNRPVNWEEVKYIDQSCSQDVCTVHLKLKYKVMVNLHGMRKIAGNSPVTERWIKESGRWYYLPDNNQLRPRPTAPAESNEPGSAG
jgi:hypothetical protein